MVETFIKAFVRDRYGAWRCVAPADLELPTGRIQVTPGSVFMKGTKFMNVDLAEILEQHYAKERDES